LPLGEGVVVDPFMGSGSTVAAAEALGYVCIGVERLNEYYEMAQKAVPALSLMTTEDAQLSLALA
jgi:site-specific DNA-methyltransferase (adenine-specific)